MEKMSEINFNMLNQHLQMCVAERTHPWEPNQKDAEDEIISEKDRIPDLIPIQRTSQKRAKGRPISRVPANHKKNDGKIHTSLNQRQRSAKIRKPQPILQGNQNVK